MADGSGFAFRRVLFHGPLPRELAEKLEAEAIRAERFRADAWTLSSDEIGLVIADPALAESLSVSPPSGLGEAADRIGLLQLGGQPEGLDGFWAARLFVWLPEAAPAPHLTRAVLTSFRVLEERTRAARDRRALLARTAEARALVEVGIALSAQTERAELLETILTRARRLTAADAGSLYLVAPSEGADSLRFVLAQNDSVRFQFDESTLPLGQSSIAGFVARTGTAVNLEDARQAPQGAPYRFDPDFDERHGYRTHSILAVPMTTPDGRTIGVLQLINRKHRVLPDVLTTGFVRSEVVPFDEGNEEIARSLAAQAAVAVENRRLTESIRSLFEGFVEASVTAIEQRDPTTSGHSHRVAALTCALAQAVDRTPDGPYASYRVSRDDLRELRYAAVLHDFGKVGVRERVLVKARKLSAEARELLRSQFDQAILSAAAQMWERAAREGGSPGAVDEALARRRNELERAWEIVHRADEPNVHTAETDPAIESLRGLEYRGVGGDVVALVPDSAISCLSIRKGSLTPAERAEIESHVTQTFRFLGKIPWTRDLARVPEWAYAHHEKLNGSGYPRGLLADRIPVPVRMLTICDIFDALAARDRPYKPAVPRHEALEILAAQAEQQAVDPSLLRIFIDAGIWKIPSS